MSRAGTQGTGSRGNTRSYISFLPSTVFPYTEHCLKQGHTDPSLPPTPSPLLRELRLGEKFWRKSTKSIKRFILPDVKLHSSVSFFLEDLGWGRLGIK